MKRFDRAELGPMLERVGVILAAAVVVWAAWSWVDRALLPSRSAGAAAADQARASERAAAAVDETVRLIQDRAIFQPPKPSGFQLQLTGVAGTRAIFTGGQAAGAGDQVGGATVLAVGPDWAQIEFEGETQTLYLFGPREGAGPGVGGGGGGGEARGARPGGPGVPPSGTLMMQPSRAP